MDSVRAELEGEVGPVVQDEGNVVLAADLEGDAGARQQRSCFERLFPQLDDVDPAADAGGQKAGQIGAIGTA